jgi:sugar phosphate isomerase/epimerase
MKAMNRREALAALAGGCSALMLGGECSATEAKSAQPMPPSGRSGLGIVIYTLQVSQNNGWGGRHKDLSPALAFLEESRALGAGGIQYPFGPQDSSRAAEVRPEAEKHGMFVEGILSFPSTPEEADRFEQAVKNAKAAGASLARTAVLPGRRYEQFKSFQEFRQAEKRALQVLQSIEPVLARHRFRLAVENHKDQRAPEKLALLKSLSSEWVGLCADFINNLALVEDPVETLRSLAPWAITSHIKDAAVRECEEGFLLADVALGDGFLDLPAMVRILRRANPSIHFCLEIITRDALKVPVKTDAYWSTFEGVPRGAAEPILGLVRAKGCRAPLAEISKLPVAGQMALERLAVERSVKYAREKLSI